MGGGGGGTGSELAPGLAPGSGQGQVTTTTTTTSKRDHVRLVLQLAHREGLAGLLALVCLPQVETRRLT